MYPKLNLTAVSQVRITFIKTKNKKVWEINNETPEGKICLCLWGEEVLLNIRCLFVFCLLIVVFLCTCCFSCFFCPLFCVLILLAKYSVLHLLSSIQAALQRRMWYWSRYIYRAWWGAWAGFLRDNSKRTGGSWRMKSGWSSSQTAGV